MIKFNRIMKPIFLYLLLINSVTFLVYGLDKWMATQQKWRISEKKLLSLVVAGGTIGGVLGMLIFRHKTKKKSFKIVLFVIIVLQLIALYFYFFKNQS